MIPEYARAEGQRECVSFEAMGFRDVVWCCYLNEPTIMEYRDGPAGRQTFCPNCEHRDPERASHHFICHIGKTRR